MAIFIRKAGLSAIGIFFKRGVDLRTYSEYFTVFAFSFIMRGFRDISEGWLLFEPALVTGHFIPEFDQGRHLDVIIFDILTFGF